MPKYGTVSQVLLQLVVAAHKPDFVHHLWSKENYQALFVYCSDLGQNLCRFLPYFTYNSAVFPQNNLTTPNCTHSIQGDQSTRFLSPCTTNYKNENNIKRFYLEDSTILQDCSFRSICSCVVCSWVIMGFEQKLSKRSWKFNFQNHPSGQPFWTFAPQKDANCSVNCRVLDWTVPDNRLRFTIIKKSIYLKNRTHLFKLVLKMPHVSNGFKDYSTLEVN